jgi:DNA-binding NtrC family response regulator
MGNILIIDEKSGVRNILAEGLAWEGYTVFNIGNPASIGESMQLIRPDLVTINPFFGGVDRFDALEEIKKENFDDLKKKAAKFLRPKERDGENLPRDQRDSL